MSFRPLCCCRLYDFFLKRPVYLRHCKLSCRWHMHVQLHCVLGGRSRGLVRCSACSCDVPKVSILYVRKRFQERQKIGTMLLLLFGCRHFFSSISIEAVVVILLNSPMHPLLWETVWCRLKFQDIDGSKQVLDGGYEEYSWIFVSLISKALNSL